MKKIESNWDGISGALKAAVRLVSKLGYRRDNLTATNAIIPIAYFIYINEFEDSILHNSEREDDRKSIREWLARVLLKGTFGGQPDSLYPKMRELMNKHKGRFPLKEIIANYSGQRKSISFSEEDIENLLDLEYGKRGTYSALTLLYPGLNYTFNYHQDHIHPKSAFHKTSLRKAGFSEEDIDNFKMWFNTLPNLQLMQETENIQKSAKPFETWLDAQYPTESGRNAYLQQHYISTEASLTLKDFEAFHDERWETLKQKFIEILGATVSTEELET